VGEFVGEKRGGEGRGRRVVMCNGEGLVGCVWLVSSRFVRVIMGFPTKWFPVGDTMSIIQVQALALRRGLGKFFLSRQCGCAFLGEYRVPMLVTVLVLV